MKIFALYVLLLPLLLAGCAQAAAPNPAGQAATQAAVLTAQASLTPPAFVLTTEAAPSMERTATSTPVPSASSTPLPTSVLVPTSTLVTTSTLVPTGTPTPASPYPALTIATELPPLGPSGLADLHGLILFRSWEGMPFVFAHDPEADYRGALTRTCHFANGWSCLWALSPDGQRGGLLNPELFDFHMMLLPGPQPLMVENGFIANRPEIQTVRLPEICSQDLNSTLDQRCDRIQLSADGRYLAFRYGQEVCGRAMQVVDRQTGEIILELENGVHGFGFLPNGKLSISQGHCEGSSVSYFDPLTRKTVGGGGSGVGVWNQNRTILVVASDSYMGNSSALWGYNASTGDSFQPEENSGWRYDEHVIFLPDDRRFLYQHLRIGRDPQMGTAVFNTPAQIVRYDPGTGQRVELAADPAYHYRLCQFDHEQPCPLLWYGDWIQIQRVPFVPSTPKEYDWSFWSEFPCLAEGKECAAPPESLALNSHTGEIRPWDPAALPPPAYPTPTATPGPDYANRPIYSDPAGQYELLIGSDFQSLWMLPKDGPAVQWVRGGDSFFYLP